MSVGAGGATGVQTGQGGTATYVVGDPGTASNYRKIHIGRHCHQQRRGVAIRVRVGESTGGDVRQGLDVVDRAVRQILRRALLGPENRHVRNVLNILRIPITALIPEALETRQRMVVAVPLELMLSGGEACPIPLC